MKCKCDIYEYIGEYKCEIDEKFPRGTYTKIIEDDTAR